MKRPSFRFKRLCTITPLLVLTAVVQGVSAGQPAATGSAQLCNSALHSAKSLGQWDLNLGPDRTATRALTLPPDHNVLLEATEFGVNVELTVTVSTTVTMHVGNPVLRHGVLRVLLRTNDSGETTVAAHAGIDAGLGHLVKLQVYDEAAPETDNCEQLTRDLADADSAFAQARQTPDGLGTAKTQSPMDFYRAAYAGYERGFRALAPDNAALRGELAHSLATLSCQYMQRWRDCGDWSEKAIRLLAVAGDAHGRADARSLQAVSWMALAQLPDPATAADPVRRDSQTLMRRAHDQLRDLARFYQSRGEELDAAEQLNLIGLIAYDTGNYSAALSSYHRAALLCEQIGARYRLALVLQNIALADWDLGRLTTAQNTFRRALALVNAEESPALYSLILNNYGLVNRTAGHLDAALAQHSQALDLTTRIQRAGERARSLSGIGFVYSAAGDRDLASTFLHQALDAFVQDGEGREQVSVLRALANIAAEDGHQEEAIRLDRDALGHAIDPMVRAHLLVQIADSESKVGRSQLALDDLALAERIPRTKDAVSRSFVEHERGILAYRTGQFAEARALLEEALTTDQAYGLDAAAFDNDVALAQVNVAAGHTSLAMRELDAALDLSEVLRLQVSDPELRASTAQPLRPAFELKVDLLARASQSAGSTGDARGAERTARMALAVTERSRSRVMRDISVADYSQGSRACVDQLLARKSQLLADLAAHQDRLESAGVRSPREPAAVTTRADIAHLREQLALTDSQLAILSRAGPASVQTRTDINPALPSDVAIVAYWIGNSDAYAWLQTDSQVRLIDLGSADALRVAADAERSAYDTPDGSSAEKRLHVGASLSRIVLQPVLAQMPTGVTRLIVIPDGPLHYVSFATLPERAEAGDSFLIKKYEVAYASSVGTLLRPADRRGQTDGMLLVADPVYGADDPRLALTKPSQPLLAAQSPHLRGGLQLTSLERLPASGPEARGIAALAAPLRVDDLEGFQATRDSILSRPLDRYRYIHFAVHATTDADIPQLSSLVLSTYGPGGQAVEDRIWAGDLMGRRFNARTVVLSACDTALGRDIGSEGLFSLRYVLLARGAESVVASLWAVPDRSTATLMQSFYKGLLQEQLRPEAALAIAMRQMLAQGPHDPAFWGPFTATIASLH